MVYAFVHAWQDHQVAVHGIMGIPTTCMLLAGWLQMHAACMLGLRWCDCLDVRPLAYNLVAPSDCRTGSTLRIGHPLDHDQRKVMACLCEDANVPYEVVPDPVTDALA